MGGSLAASYYRRKGHRLGAESKVAPYALTAVGMIVGTVGIVALGSVLGLEKLSAVGALLVVAAGFPVFARLSRNTSLGLTSVGLALAVLVMWAAGLSTYQIGFAGNELFGVTLVILGLLSRPRRVAA